MFSSLSHRERILTNFTSGTSQQRASVKLPLSRKGRPRAKDRLLNHCNSDNYLLPNKGNIVG